MAATEEHTPVFVLPGKDQEWLAKRREEILDPDRPIVDPHHHLWGPPRHTYLAEDLLADAASGHNIAATVYVDCLEAYLDDAPEMMRPLGEVRFAVAQAAAAPADGPELCKGIVGHADFRHGAAIRELLEAQIEAGEGRFRGIRQSAVWDPSGLRTSSRIPVKGLLMSDDFREGFGELGRLGLSFDSWNYFHQIPELADLASAFPETQIVLDHVGGVLGIGPYEGRREELFDAWRENVQDLARRPNVAVKLGGLAMHTVGFGLNERPEPPSSEELATLWAPYFEICLDAFGVDRCMFESNFPVDGTSCSYHVLWNAMKRLSSAMTEAEKTALFSGTAARIYRL